MFTPSVGSGLKGRNTTRIKGGDKICGVRYLLSVIIWALSIAGAISTILMTFGWFEISWYEAISPIIGAFLICFGYLAVRTADERRSLK